MTMSDPIFAVLTRWHAADAAYRTAHARARAKWPNDPARAEDVANRATWGARDRALEELYGTQPTLLQGLAALVAVFCEEDLEALHDVGLAGRGLHTILRSVQHLAREASRSATCDSIAGQASARLSLAVA